MVQIRIFDILYDNNVCNLIYMEDMTKVYRDIRHERAQMNLQIANSCIQEELEAPLRTSTVLSKELLKDCSQKQEFMIKTIHFSACLVAMLISNMKEFQNIKQGEFAVRSKHLNPVKCLEKVIQTHSIQAQSFRCNIVIKPPPQEEESAPMLVMADSERIQ